jgi:hypothetical protein
MLAAIQASLSFGYVRFLYARVKIANADPDCESAWRMRYLHPRHDAMWSCGPKPDRNGLKSS